MDEKQVFHDLPDDCATFTGSRGSRQKALKEMLAGGGTREARLAKV
ncbi:hypothetical protein [Methanoculleus sp. MH98A]|nr:hypothetical protein [Methanoculleus sp. MH98A]